MVTSIWPLVQELGRLNQFLMTLQIEILVTVTSDFLKQMIILKSFSSGLGKNLLSGSISSLLRNLF